MMKDSVSNPGGRAALILIGAAFGALFFLLAAARLDWTDVREALAGARLWPWAPLGAAFYLLGHLARGQRCRLLLSREANLPVATAANIVVIGYAVNNVLPLRSGEIARVGMLSERTGIPLAQSFTVTVLERLLDSLVILYLLLVAYALADAGGWIGRSMAPALALFALAAAGMLFAVLAPQLLLALASRAARRLGDRWHDRAVRAASSVTQGVAFLRSPRAAGAIALWSFAIWSLEAAMFASLLPAFGLEFNAGNALLAMAVANLAIWIPSTPGHVGTFHFFCMKALESVGVPAATAFSYAIVVHLTFFIPTTLWGGLALVRYGFEVGSSIALARAARRLPPLAEALEPAGKLVSASAPPVKPPLDPFTRAMVEALLPLERVQLSAPDRVSAVEATAEFVQGQAGALPPRLALLYGVGMRGFNFLIALYCFRSFASLPLERRRSIVNAWAYGRLALARNLFRMPRSTALLCFYELPQVEAALEGGRGAEPKRAAEER